MESGVADMQPMFGGAIWLTNADKSAESTFPSALVSAEGSNPGTPELEPSFATTASRSSQSTLPSPFRSPRTASAVWTVSGGDQLRVTVAVEGVQEAKQVVVFLIERLTQV